MVCVTSALVLNEGSHVPPGTACYPDVVFCVPTEGCGAACICCATSRSVITSDDLKS